MKISEVKVINETRADEVWNQIKAARDALPRGPERVRLSNLMNQINRRSTPDAVANEILAQANLNGAPAAQTTAPAQPQAPTQNTAPATPAQDPPPSTAATPQQPALTARETWNQIKAARDALPRGPERVRLSNLMNQINVSTTTPEDAAEILAQAEIDSTAPTAQPSGPTTRPNNRPTAGQEPAGPTTRPNNRPTAGQQPAAQTTPNVNITQTLRQGMRGPQVKELQTLLGFQENSANAANRADGIFGPGTAAAVKRLQQSAGIQVDGIVGRQTLAALQRYAEVPSAPASNTVTPGPVAAPSTAPTTSPRPQARPTQQNASKENMGNKLNEANMNISVNGDSAAEVAELMRIMQLSGAPSAKPVGIDDINPEPKPCPMCGKIHDNDPISGGCASSKPSEPGMGDMIRMISQEEEDLDGGFGDATTEPAEYTTANAGDVSDIIPSGDDLHKEKGSYPATAGGDNPMNTKESIKASLLKALQEKKAKPDFLDVDKDGDKKEPMKKALKDKNKK